MANENEKELIRRRTESARKAGHGTQFDVGAVVDSSVPDWIKVQFVDGSSVAAHPTGLMRLEASQRCITDGDRVIVSLPTSDHPAHLFAYTGEGNYRADRTKLRMNVCLWPKPAAQAVKY